MSMSVRLSTASAVNLAQVDPASPSYDLEAARVDLVFTNQGVAPLTFPGEGITRRVIRVYQNTRSGAREKFDMNEPPVGTANLITLSPGQSWTYGIGFELPERILTPDDPLWQVQVCAEWSKAELDASLFPDGSYGWAESFRACSDVTIRR